MKEERAARVIYMRQKVLQLTRHQFSKITGVPYNSLQNWEQARNKGLTEEGAGRLLNAYQHKNIACNIEWLMYGIGEKPLPLIDNAKSKEEKMILQELELFHKHHSPAINTVIQDNTLLPLFRKGDYVAGKIQPPSTLYQLIGLPCIIKHMTDEYSIKFIMDKKSLKQLDIKKAAAILWHRKFSCQINGS